MKKLVKDGMVAVLISPGFGAGWYSWNSDYPEALFHPDIVEKVIQCKNNEITEEFVKKVLGLKEEDYFCDLGASDLEVCWVKEGTPFRIEDYDGSETLITIENLPLIA